jgi:hypothetical protein
VTDTDRILADHADQLRAAMAMVSMGATGIADDLPDAADQARDDLTAAGADVTAAVCLYLVGVLLESFATNVGLPPTEVWRQVATHLNHHLTTITP